MKCARCQAPLPVGRGHTCDGMVPDPVLQRFLETVRRRGLLPELARLAGADEARLLVREAWVLLDDPPGRAARKPVGFIWRRAHPDQLVLAPEEITIVYAEESNDQ